MIMILVVFNSRNETLYFAQALKNQGVFFQIVNTPKEAGQACGISVKCSERILPFAKNILSSRPFRSFVGCFRFSQNGSRTVLEKLF